MSAMDDASLKKLKQTIPVNRYSAKFGISDRNMVEKTIYCTVMVSNGFKKLHNIPSTDRLYFVLKSRRTNCLIRNLYR